MPKTLFRPQIDGVANIPVDSASQALLAVQRKAFYDAVADVIEELKPTYNGALVYYRVEETLTAAIEADIPPEFLQQRGLLLVMFDYFYSRQFRPRDFLATATIPAHLGVYLERRARADFQANAKRLLTWLAIGYLIPVDWLSADQLIESTRQELEYSGILKSSSIELDLKIAASGQRWLAENTRQEYRKLKGHLDDGHPRPVRLIECCHNLYRNRTIIVYGYEEANPQDIILYVYDINGLPVQKTLRLQWPDGNLSFTHNQLFRQAGELKGFFCEAYTVETPPISRTMRWLQLLFPLKLAWYAIRYLRILNLWLGGLVLLRK